MREFNKLNNFNLNYKYYILVLSKFAIDRRDGVTNKVSET